MQIHSIFELATANQRINELKDFEQIRSLEPEEVAELESLEEDVEYFHSFN